MITVKPFQAVMPKKEFVKQCAALPYDVMSSDEAREMVKGNPYSFLHIDKAEIDLPKSVNIYDDAVYQKASETLKAFEKQGIYQADVQRRFYFYRQIMNGNSQTGIVGCASIDDYLENRIKKHEKTRADKEADRIRHVSVCSAQTGPIFLAYKDCLSLDAIILSQTAKAPIFDFVAEDGVQHTVWVTDNAEVDSYIEHKFRGLDALYIADGHHRAASAVKVGVNRRAENPDFTGKEEFNFFLSVIFPADSLKIFDYNRLVKDLNGYSVEAFLQRVRENLGEVSEVDNSTPYRPQAPHTIGMYVGGKWYCVRFKKELCGASSPSERLDCAILQKYLFEPVLGIADPRTDKRIDFVGGIRGLQYLQDNCAENGVAFSMFPTSMDELTAVADANELMPPKSTWFEPKLRSGIFIHKI